MFQAVVDATTLQTALGSVGVLVEESRMHLREDGLAITAADPANVGMVDLELAGAAFETYEADGERIGVHLSRLHDIAGMADADQRIHLTLDEERRTLHIQIGGLAYTLGLIDPESVRSEPDIPDLEWPGRIALKGREIDRAVSAAGMVTDSLTLGIDTDAERVYIDAQGDTDTVRLDLTRDDLIDLTVGPARAVYSLDYLEQLNRAFSKETEVVLDVGEDVPMRMQFQIADGDGDVTFVLAPRVDAA